MKIAHKLICGYLSIALVMSVAGYPIVDYRPDRCLGSDIGLGSH